MGAPLLGLPKSIYYIVAKSTFPSLNYFQERAHLFYRKKRWGLIRCNLIDKFLMSLRSSIYKTRASVSLYVFPNS